MQMSNNVAKDIQRGLQHPTSGTQLLTPRSPSSRVAKTTYNHIAVYLGPASSNAAIRSCALRVFGREPEDLELSDLPQLLIALRPMLDTLLGASHCRILLRRIERDLIS